MIETRFKLDGLKFYDHDKVIIGQLYQIFEFIIEKKELLKIADNISIKNPTLILKNEVDVYYKIHHLVKYKISNELINTINNRKAYFIDKDSNIPLVGSNSIGIVDRNTSLIELKPITGCNINCIFCSLSQSPLLRDKIDFVVEYNYLIKQLRNHIYENKKGIGIEIHLNCNGEPLLYSKTKELIKGLKTITEIRRVSLDTNAVLLDKNEIKELKKAGLDQLNISIHTLDKKKGILLSGMKDYDIDKIIKNILEAQKIIDVIIAPVWIKGYNDDDIEDLVKFAKKHKLRIGIQNYLRYTTGRSIAKEVPWKTFYDKLKAFEEKYKLKLILEAKDFKIVKTKPTKKPFKKNNVIEAQYIHEGHFKDTYLFMKDNRLITVYEKNSKKIKDVMKVKIIRDKHNVFNGILV